MSFHCQGSKKWKLPQTFAGPNSVRNFALGLERSSSNFQSSVTWKRYCNNPSAYAGREIGYLLDMALLYLKRVSRNLPCAWGKPPPNRGEGKVPRSSKRGDDFFFVVGLLKGPDVVFWQVLRIFRAYKKALCL